MIPNALRLLRGSYNELMKPMITLRVFVFSDEATFHTSGKVNRQNVRIWELENPRVVFRE
jgi:hypothetical protein